MTAFYESHFRHCAELKKILGFYNNERSHDFDEDILKTQLQIFSKNFPLKEQLSIIDIENYILQRDGTKLKEIVVRSWKTF